MADDETTLEEIRERIIRYATSRGCRTPEAEDLAQETFIVLHAKYRELASGDLIALAYTTASNLLKNHMRKVVVRNPHVPVEDIQVRDLGETPEDSAIRGEELENLSKAVGRLKEPCRSFIRMLLEGMTLQEIQQAYPDAAANTIYTWKFRCKKSLLQLMTGGK